MFGMSRFSGTLLANLVTGAGFGLLLAGFSLVSGHPITVANGASNQLISLAGVDVSQLKGVFIASDQDVLVEFNSNAGSGGALNLEANMPYMWQVGDVNALLITADITAVYVTNASGADATLYFYFLHDATV